MVKIQIKRVKRSKHYEYNRLDSKFVNGTIHSFPEVGDQMTVLFDRLDWGVWHTSLVTKIIPRKTVVVVQTNNSIYHIKYGWKEENYVN